MDKELLDYEYLVSMALDNVADASGLVYAILALAECQNTLIGLHPASDATYDMLDSIKTILERVERKI